MVSSHETLSETMEIRKRRLTNNRRTEKGQTHPTAKGKTVGLLNPVSLEVSMASVALLAHSYPAK